LNLDAATLNLIFIGTPGVVCYFVVSKLLGRVGRGSLEVVTLIFMYAMLSYASYAYAGRIAALFGLSSTAAELALASPSAMTIRTVDVAGASFASVVLAYAFAFGYRHNAINRIGQKIKATNRAGDEDVWHFFHNSSSEPWSSEWIVVRDHKVGLQYFGAVSHWSESGEDRELFMIQVSVFQNSDGTKLYDCDHMYICRNKDDLTIEIHAKGRGQKK
jgi:hypothetical protein